MIYYFITAQNSCTRYISICNWIDLYNALKFVNGNKTIAIYHFEDE